MPECLNARMPDMIKNLFAKGPLSHVPQAPTNPGPKAESRGFDVADLYKGPVAQVEEQGAADLALDEKLRQAYFWIVNNAIISPHYDVEYTDGPCQTYSFGSAKINLPSDQSYSSFVLLPLLNFAVRRRCLMVGGPSLYSMS